MDRTVYLVQDDCTFAEMEFRYDQPTSGKVSVIINEIIELPGGVKTVVPLKKFVKEFAHGELRSVAALREHDMAICEQASVPMSENLAYRIDPAEYRYLLTDDAGAAIGIADVTVNFQQDTKTMRFLSAQRRKDDLAYAGGSAYEYNRGFVSRYLYENMHLEVKTGNITEVR